MKDISGKVAVITGGASGIGLATARVLAREGAKLVLADIEQGPLDAAVESFTSAGVEAIGVRTDVSIRAQVNAMADQAFDHFGKVHILFNNAGIALNGSIQDMSHEDWEWSINVNLWGPIHGVEAFVPRMIEQNEGGHILATASFAGLVPNQGLGVYCVTKYGVVALCECLSRDLRPHNIGVSVLCPMIVNTNIRDSARNRHESYGGKGVIRKRTEEEQENLRGGTIEVEGVAELVVNAIKTGQLYIHTHADAQKYITRRFERIDQAFESLSA